MSPYSPIFLWPLTLPSYVKPPITTINCLHLHFSATFSRNVFWPVQLKLHAFRLKNGGRYLQIDGVSMGGALSVTFANFYICHIDNSILDNNPDKAATCCRYVEDCYVVTRNEQHLHSVKESLEETSVLKFTYELSTNNAINFLNVYIDCISQPDKHLCTANPPALALTSTPAANARTHAKPALLKPLSIVHTKFLPREHFSFSSSALQTEKHTIKNHYNTS